jgi:quinol---cytochrome c reductase iron-sulfur subunit, bacillus type
MPKSDRTTGGSPGSPATRGGTAATADPAHPSVSPRGADDRRGFFLRLAAVVIGGLVALFPFAAGLLVLADPLRRKGASQGFLKVTVLDAIPDDGVPRQFQVLAGRTDAWNYFPNEPVGAVFLCRQKGSQKPEVFQSTCPHAGCMIDYQPVKRLFKCPCHNSAFQLDGEIIQPSPSPRAMDRLTCEVRDQGGVKEVWIEFQNFYTGVAEKIPKT